MISATASWAFESGEAQIDMSGSLVVRILLLGVLVSGCQQGGPSPSAPSTAPNRQGSIPSGLAKVSPADDSWQPTIASGWSRPVPVGAPIDTAGAEDSPFVAPDGRTLYFFFTPDASVPVQGQVSDGVTGIWASRAGEGGWLEPDRVVLASPGQAHLDGCPVVTGDRMYFCSARAGNLREIDIYVATLANGVWIEPKNAGPWFNQTAEVGEMHITANGRELYFASRRAGGAGGFDLWLSRAEGAGWSPPENLGSDVNTTGDENRPFVTQDGKELWFDSASRKGRPGPAVYRCLRGSNGSWGECTEIVSTFAGEPTLSGDGKTLYFVHHYYSADLKRMIEADIYVAVRQAG
jgi:hypothetical protein